MARTVAIGVQDFKTLVERNYFYVDKTDFIREWWEGGDNVTLITRPRRFGKTLNMSMLDYFFSNRHAGEGSLFEGLSIWQHEAYRALQGTYPVISLSFAKVKERSYAAAFDGMCRILYRLLTQYEYLLESDRMPEEKKCDYAETISDLKNARRTSRTVDALNLLSEMLYLYYGKKVIILLDEYDTPMQEAYVGGYWEELVDYTRNLFNATFKTNEYFERAIMTGITRVSRESMFSDLNNLRVVTTTTPGYETAFGFTEQEVFAALEELYRADEEEKQQVRRWYDGFIFGKVSDIYNPWSIINYLKERRLGTYWVNTSSNSLASKLIREGDSELKLTFDRLLHRETVRSPIDEQIVYNQLDGNEPAILSLLVASGYLKVLSAQSYRDIPEYGDPEYELALTNHEVWRMFRGMASGWFSSARSDYNGFIRALVKNDLEEMNHYMERVTASTFSSFDTGGGPRGAEPERFYHGFVLGLLVDMEQEYVVTSNRESGFGRYDVMIEPRDKEKSAYILEFKVQGRQEKTLEETVGRALEQIERKQYAKALIDKGIDPGRIHKYGFAFCGKEVLIGEG